MDKNEGSKTGQPSKTHKRKGNNPVTNLTPITVPLGGVSAKLARGKDLSGLGLMVNPATSKADGSQSTSHGLGLNAVTVPELNVDAADLGCDGSENSARHGPTEKLQAVDSQVARKRPSSTDVHGNLDNNFEYCVKVIRELEIKKHITLEFRLKLLTWFSLRSSETERRVVNAYIRTLGDDPSDLAEQLVHSFAVSISSNKKPRTGL